MDRIIETPVSIKELLFELLHLVLQEFYGTQLFISVHWKELDGNILITFFTDLSGNSVKILCHIGMKT